MEMGDWDDCQRSLGIRFQDKSLLQQAFVHSSYLNENPGCEFEANERLEFLGDAILNMVVAEELYREYPALSEGDLTRMRASLVCRETLAEAASSLRLGDWLLLGQGEQASGGRSKESNMANVMEALLGALFLDRGLSEAREFALSQLKPASERVKTGGMPLNYKALVQELIQGEKRPLPLYRLVEADGPDHDKRFTVEVVIEGKPLGKGMGKTKKAAEMEAARSAWEELRCSNG